MLEEMGLEFEVMSADIDEKAIRRSDPKELVMALAKAKAEALKTRISEPAILITSDQVAVCEGSIREKPETEREAIEFLESYKDYPVETVTAVAVTNLATGKQLGEVDVAKVFFHHFLEKEIDELIAGGQVFHLAGGFDIDGEPWESHVKSIEGARDSIIGLPKDITTRLIREVQLK